MAFGMTQFKQHYEWNNWYLRLKNRHNGVSFPILDNAEKDDLSRLGANRQDWKIYISMDLDNGEIYQTSNIVGFDADLMQVTTKNGSNYKLETPLNDSQLKLIKLYFRKDEFNPFDALEK